MKKIALLLLLATLPSLTGCLSLSYDRSSPPPSHHSHGDQYRDGASNRYDRDGDDIPNRYDRTPSNLSRY